MTTAANQFGIDYAYPGLCSLCHAEVAEFDGSYQVRVGVFRPVIRRLKSNHREMAIKLDDGSSMRVVLCATCLTDFKPENMGPLLESEINGWQREVDDLLTGRWDETKKRDYMTRYSARKGIDRQDMPFTDQERVRVTSPRKDKLKVRTKQGEPNRGNRR